MHNILYYHYEPDTQYTVLVTIKCKIKRNECNNNYQIEKS